jgi:circadian clock protein KaiC
MSMSKKMDKVVRKHFPKTLTGISGLDDITNGGLPTGRPTLICGSPGAGKTLFSLEFIFNGAKHFNEPGVIMTFEEKAEDLETNVASIGFDLEKMQKDKKIIIDHAYIDRSEIQETGEYDLDGLFIRLGHAIDSIGAKRVMLDTIENLFGGLSNEAILRSEIRRLFGWLKEKQVTTIITAEKGEKSLTRQGLEEYVSDCVILLDHRVNNQISTRLLRIVKYRGSVHGTNEYPFLIDENGISVLPVTSPRLNKNVSTDRVSSGIPSLDEMIDGGGFFRGGSIMISGTAGTGKTSMAVSLANASCLRKEKCLYYAFEESPQQIIRNMKSIGINLEPYIKSGLMEIVSARPNIYGLEMHLVSMYKKIAQMKPRMVIIDPVTNLISIGSMSELKSVLIRLIDLLQNDGITAVFTSLIYNNDINTQTDEGLASLVDAWIQVRDIETNGERNRGIYIMKARGMGHSNKVREFEITKDGIQLIDVYAGPEGVLVGSARLEHEINSYAGVEMRKYAISRKEKEIEQNRISLERKISALNDEFEMMKDQLNKVYMEEDMRKDIIEKNKKRIVGQRKNANKK